MEKIIKVLYKFVYACFVVFAAIIALSLFWEGVSVIKSYIN